MRGKPWFVFGSVLVIGLIPACAGKTRSDLSSYSIVWAHPRVCGENVLDRMESLEQAGSSPRVRGKRERHVRRWLPIRLIPACAGKTIATSPWMREIRAHPRVCGENEGTWEGKISGEGSSPRVRGKLRTALAAPSVGRLIPACAGKTNNTADWPMIERAHPRVCGENTPEPLTEDEKKGSSPRVRGKLLVG